MTTSRSHSSPEFWTGYWNILYLFKYSTEEQGVAFFMMLLLWGSLLVVAIMAFFKWKSNLERERYKHSSYTQSQDFPGTPGADPFTTILYQSPELGDWYELEASRGPQDEFQSRTTGASILSAPLVPEHVTLRMSNATPPPPYEEMSTPPV